MRNTLIALVVCKKRVERTNERTNQPTNGQGVSRSRISFTQAAFSKTKFYTQKTTKDTKNTKNVSEKAKCMQFFFSLNLEKFISGKKFFTKTPRVVLVTNMRCAGVKIFQTEKSLGTDLEQNWYQINVLESVSKKFGGENSQNRS